jgi:hypothetical protein
MLFRGTLALPIFHCGTRRLTIRAAADRCAIFASYGTPFDLIAELLLDHLVPTPPRISPQDWQGHGTPQGLTVTDERYDTEAIYRKTFRHAEI